MWDELFTFLYYLVYSIFLCSMFLVVWESCRMIDEKKQRQRKGLTDYYDNPIKKNKRAGGEDE